MPGFGRIGQLVALELYELLNFRLLKRRELVLRGAQESFVLRD